MVLGGFLGAMDAIQQKYVHGKPGDVLTADGWDEDGLWARPYIAETWRCLGEASAWAAYLTVVDEEGTYGAVYWQSVTEQTGTAELRGVLRLDPAD